MRGPPAPRRVKRASSIIAACAALASASACAERKAQPDSEHPRELHPVLAGTAFARDTMLPNLISIQRTLLDAMTRGDTAALSRWLDEHFVWEHQTRIDATASSGPRIRVDGRHHIRTDFMGGYVPGELPTLPNHYEVTRASRMAAVLVATWLDRADRITTTWLNLDGTWKARRTEALTASRDR
jgi:hypothetical protein